MQTVSASLHCLMEVGQGELGRHFLYPMIMSGLVKMLYRLTVGLGLLTRAPSLFLMLLGMVVVLRVHYHPLLAL